MTVSLRELLTDRDPRNRVQAIRSLTRRPILYTSVPHFVEALDDPDPEVVEWAIVGLRRCTGEVADQARRVLWRCFDTAERRESTRSYAMVGLEKLGDHLKEEELVPSVASLVQGGANQLPRSIIHAVGMNGRTPGACRALVELRNFAERLSNKELHATINAALIRCAKRAVIERSITSDDLRAMGAADIPERLGERRIRAAIEEERARRAQVGLFHGDEDEDTLPLLQGQAGRLPGQPIVDVMERQYIQDVALMKNARIVTRLEPVRDRALAKRAKKLARFTCQVCGIAAGGRHLYTPIT